MFSAFTDAPIFLVHQFCNCKHLWRLQPKDKEFQNETEESPTVVEFRHLQFLKSWLQVACRGLAEFQLQVIELAWYSVYSSPIFNPDNVMT